MTKENQEGKNTYLIMFNRTADKVHAYNLTNKEVFINSSFKDQSHMIAVVHAYNELDAIAIMRKEDSRLLGL